MKTLLKYIRTMKEINLSGKLCEGTNELSEKLKAVKLNYS